MSGEKMNLTQFFPNLESKGELPLHAGHKITPEGFFYNSNSFVKNLLFENKILYFRENAFFIFSFLGHSSENKEPCPNLLMIVSNLLLNCVFCGFSFLVRKACFLIFSSLRT